MKAGILFLAIALVFVCQAAASDSSLLAQLEGAFIAAEDGHFLGVITTNSYDSKSILNEYGDYGGEYAEYSPFNEYTSTSPKIYTKDHKWAYLTVNRTLKPRIDPHWLIGILKANE
jgi:hypothetical protein